MWKIVRRFVYLFWVKKTGLNLRVNNFAKFNGRKASNLSKVSKFCLENKYYLHVSEFEYSLFSLHEYSLTLRRASAEGTLTLFSKLYSFCCCFKIW